MSKSKATKRGKVIEYDFSKKRKTLYHGVRVLLYFWRSLSRDGKESVLDYELKRIGEERRAKRECRTAVKSRRG